MDKNAKIFVAGHNGMVGSAVVRELQNNGYTDLILRSHSELDLTRQAEVEQFFATENPEYVVIAAAKVGGIEANRTQKTEFFYTNSMISINIIHAAFAGGVKKLINLGSSCIYPREAPQPLKEEALLTGAFEPTNDAYALAKVGAMKLCEFYHKEKGADFFSVVPTNLYGINDNFDPANSHVLPAMIRKFHEAKQSGQSVELWGDGSPLREFLYVDDFAIGLVKLMNERTANEIDGFMNMASGEECSIKRLAETIAGVVGFSGDLIWDTSKPNGMPRKLLDDTRARQLGWNQSISLSKGIEITYKWFCENM